MEIKARLPTPKAAAEAAQQLAKYVTAAGGRWGLLLYRDGPGDLRGLPPTVLALSIEALFRRLERESFEEIVRDLRNNRVHGGPGLVAAIDQGSGASFRGRRPERDDDS